MKLLLDFLPIVLFFVTFKLKGIYAATAVAIAAAAIQIAVVYLRKRKIEPMHWISLGVLSVFGGFTLLLHNELFIKWKPTILYWIFAATLTGGQLIFGKNLIRAMLQQHLSVPERVWNRLNAGWILFFIAVGALNLFVAYRFPTAAWVNFKLFGLLGCTLVFLVVQSIFLAPHIEKDAPVAAGERPAPGKD